jgi:GT2 family glycosyltransferase
VKRTSIIILNWNGKELLQQFLPTVLTHSLTDDSEIIVADNGSTDNSVDFLKTQFPDVPLILLDKNYGFAEGYNRAIQQVNSEYVVLLNSDVETTENWLQPLIDFMDSHPETAAVQPKIRAYNDQKKFEYAGAAGGFIDRYGYPFCRGRILDVLETDTGQYDETIPVFWATGACLYIRRQDYMEAGGLDARFFAHMEEIDLCWRLNARGRRIMCVPSSVVYHVVGASLSKENPRKMYLNFRNNLLMMYKNVQSPDFFSTFAVRYTLDFLAFLHLLLRGNFKNAKAVLKAHRDFLKMRSSYQSIRYKNISKATVTDISTQYKESILWKFYFGGKKTYVSLSK